jgi:hypothetical protein
MILLTKDQLSLNRDASCANYFFIANPIHPVLCFEVWKISVVDI